MVTRGLGWVLCFYDGLAGPTGLKDIRTGPSDPGLSILASGVGTGLLQLHSCGLAGRAAAEHICFICTYFLP
jgi:hypothetical protein